MEGATKKRKNSTAGGEMSNDGSQLPNRHWGTCHDQRYKPTKRSKVCGLDPKAQGTLQFDASGSELDASSAQ